MIYFTDSNLTATVKLVQGETISQVVDFNSLNITSSSVVWSVEKGNTVSISGTPTISSGVTTGTIVADAEREGCTLVRVTATFTDSQVRTQQIKFDVVSGDC